MMAIFEVLKTIPEMMRISKWRTALRFLVLDYKSKKILKKNERY